jgi:hypothetical protein
VSDLLGTQRAVWRSPEAVNYPALLKRWVIDDVDSFIAFVGSAKIEGFGQHDQTIRSVCRSTCATSFDLAVLSAC